MTTRTVVSGDYVATLDRGYRVVSHDETGTVLVDLVTGERVTLDSLTTRWRVIPAA